MTFPERIQPPLKELAKKLLEEEMYGYLEPICGLLQVCKSGRWNQVSNEEQRDYLKQFTRIFHIRAMGDGPLMMDENYSKCHEIINTTYDALDR